MSLHQIIYTSCKRGINGVNDGQQVFSYDASFKDANNDEVRRLFSYQPPELEAGVVMTEEIAATLPKSFIYRKLGNGTCALALNTYLGRDYMGSGGRFGNHLSHLIIADEGDIKNYPCEFYGSSTLRDHMEFEEVNNPEKPDFLPTPVLEKGFRVDIDNVISFLSVEGRMEIFKNMLYATLAFESKRKRVVICDKPENIIMWIAAIEYALPLRSALEINFSTYDFDPSLSSSQICGVVPNGTHYTAESQRYHFVFDLYRGNCAEFEKDKNFFDFIDATMSFSYKSLQNFHRFITEGYTYKKADEKMYDAYRLYSFLSGSVEITNLNKNEIEAVLNFADDYALPKENARILQTLLGQSEYLAKADMDVFICIVRYIITNYGTLSDGNKSLIRDIVIEKILYEFRNSENNESSFVTFYNDIESVCKQNGFSVATELISSKYREKLFAVMELDIAEWKIKYIVHILSTSAKDQGVIVNELMIETPLGQTYYGLVKSVYSGNSQNGFFLVTCILDEYSYDCDYLANMALNIEGMLLDLPNGAQEVDSMWKYFEKTMFKNQQGSFNTAYSIFRTSQRYDLIYELYTFAMENTVSISEKQRIFSEHYRGIVAQDNMYANQYGNDILNDYYDMLGNSDNEDVYAAKTELLEILSTARKNVQFAEKLVDDIIKKIPFKSPTEENGQNIQLAFEYLYRHLHKTVSNRLLLMIMGMMIENCQSIMELHDAIDSIKVLIVNGKPEIAELTDKDKANYFDWVLPVACSLCKRKKDIESVYNLFKMSNDVAAIFFSTCAKIYLKQSKSDKDYDVFCEFMGLVFDKDDVKIRQAVGKTLCKLSKKKLSNLDEVVRDFYRENVTCLRYWNEIKGVAESKSSFSSSFSGLFKRKKD